MDLAAYFSEWLASLWDLQDGTPVYLTQAFRVGRANNSARTRMRDIVLSFADIRIKNMILDIAQNKGSLLHKNERVYIFLDLTPETLQKKKEFKEISSAHNDINIRYRWITTLKLQIRYKGKDYFIQMEEEGYKVLKQLNVPTPMQMEKPSKKHKFNVLNSPDKSTKKHSSDTQA